MSNIVWTLERQRAERIVRSTSEVAVTMSALMKKLSGTWPNLERNEVDRGIDCATRPILTTRQRLPPSFGGAASALRGRGR